MKYRGVMEMRLDKMVQSPQPQAKKALVVARTQSGASLDPRLGKEDSLSQM